MQPFFQMFSSQWPGMLFIAGLIGGAIAWYATRDMRAKTAAAQSSMIGVYDQTLKVKDQLAITLAESTAQQIKLAMEERKASDARHETVIAEYRSRCDGLRHEAIVLMNQTGDLKAQVAELKARTDFKPVMDFHQTWYAETKVLTQQILEAMKHSNEGFTALTPVLAEVSQVLREFGHKTQDVKMVNPPNDPANVKVAS